MRHHRVMSSRTFHSGAYRYARDGVVLPIIETFHFAAVDALVGGGNGWTLTSMRETDQGTLHVSARGDWEHPLHRGNWTRVIVTDADLTWTSANERNVFRNELRNDDDLVLSRNGITTRHNIDSAAELFLPVLATLGASIARVAAQPDLLTVQPSLIEIRQSGRPRLDTLETLASPHLEHRSSTVLGRDELDTPEGLIRGYAYQYVGGPYREEDAFLLGGDGLLAAYRVGDTTAWRAASAPS
jgi:hypothetical protein